MTNPLTLERNPFGMGFDTVRIIGFTDEEMYNLRSLDHHEAIEKIVEILNDRNQGKGEEFRSGYGIYGLWFDNEYVYMRVGDSCE